MLSYYFNSIPNLEYLFLTIFGDKHFWLDYFLNSKMMVLG